MTDQEEIMLLLAGDGMDWLTQKIYDLPEDVFELKIPRGLWMSIAQAHRPNAIPAQKMSFAIGYPHAVSAGWRIIEVMPE